MIDVNREQLIDVREAAVIARVTIQCIHNWFNGRTGRRLESVKMGGKRFTSREALQRFSEQGEDGAPVGAVLPSGPKTDYDAAVRGFEERHGSF